MQKGMCLREEGRGGAVRGRECRGRCTGTQWLPLEGSVRPTNILMADVCIRHTGAGSVGSTQQGRTREKHDNQKKTTMAAGRQ